MLSGLFRKQVFSSLPRLVAGGWMFRSYADLGIRIAPEAQGIKSWVDLGINTIT